MKIDDSTKVLMMNWALWRLSREQPGIAVTNAYSLAGGSDGPRDYCPIVLLNDEAFEVEQAAQAMDLHLRQALVEYWLRSEPAAKKAHRCGCPLRTYWRRLERAHQAVHTFRRQLHERQRRAREAYQQGRFSFVF